MALSSKGVPRFLPTLTEIIRRPVAREADPLDIAALEQAFAERVREQVDAVVDRRLNEAIAAAVLEQVDAIAARLREEIEPMVRQAVDAVLASESGSGQRNRAP